MFICTGSAVLWALLADSTCGSIKHLVTFSALCEIPARRTVIRAKQADIIRQIEPEVALLTSPNLRADFTVRITWETFP